MALIVILVILAAVFVIGFFSTRCNASGCNEAAQYGKYCINHVCLYSGCENKRSYDGIYCYYHENLNDDGEYSSSSSPYLDLHISDIDIDTGISYITATRKLTNNGEKTYRFVQVKGAFKDYSGNVVDTDWTYACGQEGLAPGESTSFRLSIPKTSSIKECSVTLLDYE